MGYRFLDSSKIGSDNCLVWGKHFIDCSQRNINDTRLVFYVAGQIVLNKTLFMEVSQNTDWKVSEKTFVRKGEAELKHLSGFGKPILDAEQLFLLIDKRSKRNNEFLHETPGYALTHMDDEIFNDYDTAIKHIFHPHRNLECSLWQHCTTRFELLHDFSWQ